MKISLGAVLLVVLLAGLSASPYIEPLSKIGEVDFETIGKMKGTWMIDGSKYIFEYTEQYVCHIDGVKYFLYRRDRNHSRIPFIYTVIKSKKTGKRYFARGQYKNGQLLGSTSRITLKGNDRMTVYEVNSQNDVFFTARRVQVETPVKKTAGKDKGND